MRQAAALPSSFIESALPSRKEYEVSLSLLSDEDRASLEAAARKDQDLASSGSSPDLASSGSSPTSVLDEPSSRSTEVDQKMTAVLDELWADDTRFSRRRSDSRRTIHIVPSSSEETRRSSRRRVTAELASCFGPVEGSDHDSTPNDSPEGSHSPNSFRTKQLSKILEKLRATDDGEGEAAAAPAVNLVRRRRPDGHPEKLSNSVLARAGVL